jgi:hypothetical protein
MRAPMVAVLAVSAFSCAPMLSVRRDVPPRYILEATDISVVQRDTSGNSTMDVLSTVLDPLGALNRVAILTPRAVNQVTTTLQASRSFRVLGSCVPRGCTGSQAVLYVRMVTGNRQDITRAGDRSRTYRGTCQLELTIETPQGAVLYQTTETAEVEGASDVVLDATYRAAERLAQTLLPGSEVTTFVLAKEGPLSGPAKLAEKGGIDAAGQQLLAYVTANPNNAAARYHLGAVLTAKGDLEGAAEQMQYAEQLNANEYAGETEAARRRIASRDAMQRYLQSRGMNRR